MRARRGLLCVVCVVVLACGGAESYATYAEAARANSLPAYVPSSAHTFRVYSEERHGVRQFWLRFELPPGDAQRMVRDMEALTVSQARSHGSFRPPKWSGDWPEELGMHPSSVTRPTTRFYVGRGGNCVVVDWSTTVVYSYPC